MSNTCITTQYSHDDCVDDAYNVSRLHLKKDLAFYLKCSGDINNVSFLNIEHEHVRFWGEICPEIFSDFPLVLSLWGLEP